MSSEIKTYDLQPQIAQFGEVVNMIRTTREKVMRLANAALVSLYWQVGQYISEKIKTSEWGDSVIEELAKHIAKTEPELKGFSMQNLWRMKQFYETYSQADEKLSTLLREISWSNNLAIMSRCKTEEERLFYIKLSASENYSYRELKRQIDSSLFERAMMATPKLTTLLREISPDSEKIVRDKYVMEFVGGKTYKSEHSLKKALIEQMRNFILELGRDFIYIDQEYELQVGNSDFRIDLLFYHRELQCLVAFELKTGAFEPEYLGKLNFYLEALDRDVKKPKENPSIGVLLCKSKDDEVVEYALSRSLSPTMVAEYQLCLPDKKLLQQKMREIFEDTEDLQDGDGEN